MQVFNIILAGITGAEIILLGVLINTVFDMIRSFSEIVVLDEDGEE